MSTTNLLSYPAGAAATITLNSLANAAARQSAAVDNSAAKHLDYLVGGTFKTGAGSLATTPYLNIYVAALADGANYAGGATGSDASYTMPTYRQPVLLATVFVNAAGVAEVMSPKSVAALFGGICPAKFALIVENQTGLALDATAGGSLYTQPIDVTNG